MTRPDASDDPVRLFQALAQDTLATIAAVDGAAIGGGFELMLSCDLTVASTRAWFSLPELGHGVIPNTALMRLQQMIGLRGLYQLMMTGQKLDAHKAGEIGLVNRVCEPGQAIDVAIMMADEIGTRVAPGALAAAKRLAMGYAKSDWVQVQRSLQDLPEAQWREGLGAFLEKRKPDYDVFWSDHPET